MSRKGLITRIGEAIDRHLEDRASGAPNGTATSRKSQHISILPSTGNVVFSVLLVGALLLANRAGALSAFMPASPQMSTSTIAYQGRLANAGGTPLTGIYPMVFRLYDQAVGSAPLWEETWTGPNGVRVSDGLFNVMLGSLAPMQPALIASNSSLWLGITVGVDGEMAPRVQLGTVPYAMQALTVPDSSINTLKLGDQAVTNSKLADGSVSASKLMTGSVTNAKLADGSVSAAKLGNDVNFVPPDGSITSMKIADGSVDTVDLKNGAVTLDKIANGAVNQGKAPTLIAAGDGGSHKIYSGGGWIVAGGTTNYLSQWTTLPESCATGLRVFATPSYNLDYKVAALVAIQEPNAFQVYIYRTAGTNWTAGQGQGYYFLAFC